MVRGRPGGRPLLRTELEEVTEGTVGTVVTAGGTAATVVTGVIGGIDDGTWGTVAKVAAGAKAEGSCDKAAEGPTRYCPEGNACPVAGGIIIGGGTEKGCGPDEEKCWGPSNSPVNGAGYTTGTGETGDTGGGLLKGILLCKPPGS